MVNQTTASPFVGCSSMFQALQAQASGSQPWNLNPSPQISWARELGTSGPRKSLRAWTHVLPEKFETLWCFFNLNLNQSLELHRPAETPSISPYHQQIRDTYVLQTKYQTVVGNSKFWIMFVLDPANRLRIQTLDYPFKYWFVNSESQFMVRFNHPEYQPRRLIAPEINIDQSSCINYVPMLWIVNTPN